MHKTQLNLITAFVFWGVCSLACTACSQNNTIELSSYINQPISEITQVDNNFYKTDALYGTSYSNGAVNVYTNEDDDLTSSIIISAECNYSLYGVTFGMEIDKRGNQPVHIYALNIGPGNNNPQIGEGTANVKEPNVPASSVTLNKTTLILEISKSDTLTSTVYPANATDKTVNWTSSDTKVASIVRVLKHFLD